MNTLQIKKYIKNYCEEEESRFHLNKLEEKEEYHFLINTDGIGESPLIAIYRKIFKWKIVHLRMTLQETKKYQKNKWKFRVVPLTTFLGD